MEKETTNKVDWKKELYGCLEHCRYQNGRDDCKNCGLEQVMIDNALQEAYQAGLWRASEILLNEYDRAMSHGGQTFELYLDLETALSEEIKSNEK